MLNNTRVIELMLGNDVTLKPAQTLTQALSAMSAVSCTQALVMEDERLVGYIRAQDLLRGLWSCEFDADSQPTVGALMQTELPTVSAQGTLGSVDLSWLNFARSRRALIATQGVPPSEPKQIPCNKE
ncbi:MAG: CBS domain-containing protein [Shewanella sp.]|nr:CBS domain-containing protein [Shewanella sp.]